MSFIEKFLNGRFFACTRKPQFFLALIIFSTAALAPMQSVATSSSPLALHFTGNFLLMLSLWVAWGKEQKSWLLAFVIAPYSILIELLQAFTPDRVVDIADVLANLSGLFAAWLITFVSAKIWAAHKVRSIQR